TSSTPDLRGRDHKRSVGPGELLLDLPRQRERDAGDGRQLLRDRFADAPEAPEAPEQRPPPPRANAGDRVEPRTEPGAGPELSVIEVHEAVRLVAHPLEEEERARVGLQDHGVLPSRQEDALGPAADLARRRVALDALLGETDDLEARQAELGEHRARGPELAEAAVDHQQVRQPAALARVAEAPAQHLGHRREVVRALDGADAVAAVAVLVGRPLL